MDWVHDLLLLFAGAVITLIIGYLTIYTSSPLQEKFKNWRDKQAQKKAMKSVKNAKKRIESLEQDLKIISLYIKYPVILSARTFKNYALMALNFATALFVGFGYFTTYGANPLSNKSGILQVIDVSLILLSLFMVALSVTKMVVLMDKIAYLNTYDEKINKQIADLQEVIKKFEAAEVTSTPKI